MPMREKLIDIINNFFGCDAAYFSVNPFDLASHLIDNGVTILTVPVIVPELTEVQIQELREHLRNSRLQIVTHDMDSQISIINQPGWIPVTDRLPEKNTSVLVYYKHGRNIFWYDGDKFNDVDQYGCDFPVDSVTHWMPLPKPPKEVL